MIELEWGDVADLAADLAASIYDAVTDKEKVQIKAWGVPRGGIHAAQAVAEHFRNLARYQNHLNVSFVLVTNPFVADIFIDDIEDSGNTKSRVLARFGPEKNFHTLTTKRDSRWGGEWIQFPWEASDGQSSGPHDAITRIIQFIGDDPKREGLLETPDRVIRSYAELFSGYQYKTDEDIADLFKTFDDGACDEMVLVKNIEFNSFCEHHMLPFAGVAHVAYLPNKKIVGLSKLARIVDAFAQRLQVQERLTTQITTAIDTHLMPHGSACVIEARHSCMSCRGVRKQQSSMVTSSLTGNFRDSAVRQEFYSLINRS